MAGKSDFRAAQRANWLDTIGYILALVVLTAAASYAVGVIFQYLMWLDPSGRNAPLTFALVMTSISLGLSLLALLFGDHLVLGIAQARPIWHNEATHLINVVEEMSIAAGIDVPQVMIMELAEPNAFSTGSLFGEASVVVTRGLVNGVDRDELQGVVAHTVGHIVNADVHLMAMVTTSAGLMVAAAQNFFYGIKESIRELEIGMIILIVFFGVPICLLPALVWVAAKSLQKLATHERVYLADATAVA